MVFDEKELENLEVLAKNLASNYFNVSLTKADPLENNLEIERINVGSILKDPSIAKRGWMRNILVIGAGASMDSFGFIPDGIKVVERIEEKLGLFIKEGNRLNENLIKKYINLSELYLKDKILFSEIDVSLNSKLKNVQKLLLFEGRMSMLCHFFYKKDVIAELKNELTFKNKPSKYYEIVAHLFKHKFIDIIINFNFDELLDNAIEDELGEEAYHRIVADNDFASVSEILSNNRLKTPIYIKPHGTISNDSSLLFTKEQYLDISEKIKNLITKLFQGDLSAINNRVKRFNIMVAGFNMDSIEFKHILKQQVQELRSNKLKKINYFIFNKTKKVSERIRDELGILNIESIDVYSFDKGVSKHYDLSIYFEKLYEVIREQFKKPYVPNNLNRHEILCLLFPKEEFQKKYIECESNPTELENFKTEYYLRRTKFLILYETLKGKGEIALPTIANDRAAKYFLLYIKRTFTVGENLINIMDGILDFEMDNNSDLILSSNKLKNKKSKDIINYIHKEMMNLMYDSNEYKSKNEDYLRIKINEAWDIRSNEISPKYIDSKLGRLSQFKINQVLPTNLALTYKFYHFAVERMKEWEYMLAVDRTGRAILNLSFLCDDKGRGNKDHLFRIFNSGKKINLLYSEVEKAIDEDGKNKKTPIIKLIQSINIKASKDKKNFNAVEFSNEFKPHHMHYMYLFLDNKESPIFGVYHFKSRGKNRINPLFFDIKHNSKADIENLKTLKQLFLWQETKV